MFRTVQVRTESHALVRNFSQFRKAENLESAGVRQNRAIPRHEFVQSAYAAHQLVPRSQIEMISIPKDDFRAEFFERFIAQTFHRRLRADWHEKRRFHRAVR